MESERLIIRRFRPEDGRDLHAYLSDERVIAFEPYGAFSMEEAAREAARRAGDDAFWAVCLKDGGKLIGNLYFSLQAPAEFATWELGYVFGSAYHGRGYATEGALMMLRYGFEERGAHRVTAQCDPRNIPSWRLLERLGMRREGHCLKKAFFKRDEHGAPLWHDAYEYALLSEEWFSRRRGSEQRPNG